MGLLFIPAQIDKGVGVADDPFPGFLEELLELRNVLQDDGGMTFRERMVAWSRA